MKYTYDLDNSFTSQVALLTGPSPQGMNPPANSGTGFLIDYDVSTIKNCIGYGNFPFAQEPQTWAQIPTVQGNIQATIINNDVLCLNETVTILSVLFLPSSPNYPDSTYPWTW